MSGTRLGSRVKSTPPNDYRFYRAVLALEEGEEIWAQGRLRPQRGNNLVLRLPATLFKGGAYRISVSGSTNGEDYRVLRELEFNIVRK